MLLHNGRAVGAEFSRCRTDTNADGQHSSMDEADRHGERGRDSQGANGSREHAGHDGSAHRDPRCAMRICWSVRLARASFSRP